MRTSLLQDPKSKQVWNDLQWRLQDPSVLHFDPRKQALRVNQNPRDSTLHWELQVSNASPSPSETRFQFGDVRKYLHSSSSTPASASSETTSAYSNNGTSSSKGGPQHVVHMSPRTSGPYTVTPTDTRQSLYRYSDFRRSFQSKPK